MISHVMDNGEECPIASASRTHTKSERNYSQIEKEALRIVFCVQYHCHEKYCPQLPMVVLFGCRDWADGEELRGLPISAETASKTQHPCTRGDGLLKCEREYASILLRRVVTISFGLVDSHSKWIEVAHMMSTSAKSTIDQLRVWFAPHGLNEEVVSDNGPQFDASEFVDFLKQNGIKQMLVPPHHPPSNGAAAWMYSSSPKASIKKRGRKSKKRCTEVAFEATTGKLSVPLQKHPSFCNRSHTSRTVLKAQTSH